MALESAERLYLERQVTLARVVLVALALVALLEMSAGAQRHAPVLFLAVYLVIALAVVLYQRIVQRSTYSDSARRRRCCLGCFSDFQSTRLRIMVPILVCGFRVGHSRKHERAMLGLVSAAAVGVVLRMAATETFSWRGIWHWLSIGLGTLISGLGIGFLGARERSHLERRQFLEKITQLLQFDRGLTESIRQTLGELLLEFRCEQACLAIRDDELERIFVWKVRAAETEPSGPETLSPSRSDTFLTDAFEVSICWEYKDGRNCGFGWDRRTGHRVRTLLAPPGSTREEFGARSLLAVTIDASGRPAGRVLLINPEKRFEPADLHWLEQIVRHIALPMENVFRLRHLRARAVESERSRISRDLHDGILQTMLSLNIQLDVLRRKFPWTPRTSRQRAGNASKRLVKQESEELRRMVTDLRPVRVESADMRELMFGFAERFRNESGLAVDLFIEDRNLRMPDRICREMFQIYREALHNVKKHA